MEGVAAVILDEFHERSVEVDTALERLLSPRGEFLGDSEKTTTENS